MKNGYTIRWTSHALEELRLTFEYLENNWSNKELENLAMLLDQTVNLLAVRPEIFPKSGVNSEIRKAVVAKYNTLYYRIYGSEVQILSFFSNRQNPKKRKL